MCIHTPQKMNLLGGDQNVVHDLHTVFFNTRVKVLFLTGTLQSFTRRVKNDDDKLPFVRSLKKGLPCSISACSPIQTPLQCVTGVLMCIMVVIVVSGLRVTEDK